MSYKATQFPSLEADVGCSSPTESNWWVGDWLALALHTFISCHSIWLLSVDLPLPVSISCFSETAPARPLICMQYRHPSSYWGSSLWESGLTTAKTGTSDWLSWKWLKGLDSRKTHIQTLCWDLGWCALAWESLSYMPQVQFRHMMGEVGSKPLSWSVQTDSFCCWSLWEFMTWS